MEKARSAMLPPLQSVVELTSAAAPPSRNAEEMASVSSAGARPNRLLGIHSDASATFQLSDPRGLPAVTLGFVLCVLCFY